MAKPGAGRHEITVILPPEPPELNPEAARVLLKILLKAYEKKWPRVPVGRRIRVVRADVVARTTLWTIEQVQQGLGVSNMGTSTRSLFTP
jgi:hypothetical protein